MSKLNKVFVAITMALLLVAIVEVFVIFVYKPPPQEVTSPRANISPSPTPNKNRTYGAIYQEYIDFLTNAPKQKNVTYILSENVTGSVASITPQTSAQQFAITLNGVVGKDRTRIQIPPESLKRTKVFIQDTIMGNNIETNLNALKTGDNISVITNTALTAEPQTSEANLGISITIQR